MEDLIARAEKTPSFEEIQAQAQADSKIRMENTNELIKIAVETERIKMEALQVKKLDFYLSLAIGATALCAISALAAVAPWPYNMFDVFALILSAVLTGTVFGQYYGPRLEDQTPGDRRG